MNIVICITIIINDHIEGSNSPFNRGTHIINIVVNNDNVILDRMQIHIIINNRIIRNIIINTMNTNAM